MEAEPPHVIIVTGRSRPHEVVFILLSLLFGAVYTFGAPPPRSVVAQMPHPFVLVWAIFLLVGGIVGGISVIGRLSRRKLFLELASMLMTTGSLITISAAIFGYAGLTKGLFGVGFCVAWATGNLVRAADIVRRDLQEVP